MRKLRYSESQIVKALKEVYREVVGIDKLPDAPGPRQQYAWPHAKNPGPQWPARGPARNSVAHRRRVTLFCTFQGGVQQHDIGQGSIRRWCLQTTPGEQRTTAQMQQYNARISPSRCYKPFSRLCIRTHRTTGWRGWRQRSTCCLSFLAPEKCVCDSSPPPLLLFS
jgi:hypothetical protein